MPWRDLDEDGFLDKNVALNDKLQELEQKYFKDETGEIDELDELKQRVEQLEKVIRELGSNKFVAAGNSQDK